MFQLYFLSQKNLGLKASNNKIINKNFFDTIKVKPKISIKQIREQAESKKINLRYYEDGQHVGISLDETVALNDLKDLFEIFNCDTNTVIHDNNFEFLLILTVNRFL